MADKQLIEINGEQYDWQNLSDKVKQLIQLLGSVDSEIDLCKRRLNIFQTARAIYAAEIKKELETIKQKEESTH